MAMHSVQLFFYSARLRRYYALPLGLLEVSMTIPRPFIMGISLTEEIEAVSEVGAASSRDLSLDSFVLCREDVVDNFLLETIVSGLRGDLRSMIGSRLIERMLRFDPTGEG